MNPELGHSDSLGCVSWWRQRVIPCEEGASACAASCLGVSRSRTCRLCYRLSYVPPRFICGSPSPQGLNCDYSWRRGLEEVTALKQGPWGGGSSCYVTGVLTGGESGRRQGCSCSREGPLEDGASRLHLHAAERGLQRGLPCPG